MERDNNSLSLKLIIGSLSVLVLIAAWIFYRVQHPALAHEFTTSIYPKEVLEPYRHPSEQLPRLATLPVTQQLDSLLLWTHIVRDLDEGAAQIYAQQAADLAKAEQHTAGQAYSAYYLGLIRGRTSLAGEDLEIPLADARKSYRLFSRIGNEEWTLRSLGLMGALFYQKKQYDSTGYYLTQALERLEEAKLGTVVKHSLRGEFYHSSSNLKVRQDSLELAARLRQLAKTEYLLSKDEPALGRLNLSMAIQDYRAGRIAKGDSLMAEVVTNLRNSNDRYGLYYALERLGYQKLQEGLNSQDTTTLRLAQRYLREAIELQPEKSYNALKFTGMVTQAMASFAPDSYKVSGIDSAVLLYYQAMENAREAGAMSAFRQTSQVMVSLCDFLRTKTDRTCDSLLQRPLLEVINTNYAGALATTTERLNEANRERLSFEMEQQSELSARKRRMLTFGGVALLAIAGLVFFSIFQRQRRKQVETRMATLRAQINPHFMSNSLNAIESLVNFGDRKDAAKYLIHFSRLTRQVLNNSMVPITSLASELATMKHFLALEQLRLGDRLSYSIDVAEGLNPDQISIPSMILQPYIENAIWHGIKPKDGSGHIEIYCEREDHLLICSIEDDGIGREAAGELKKASLLKQKSVGMKITEERIAAAGRQSGTGVRIIDLKGPEGEVLGTRVVIRLPFKTVKTAVV